MPTDPPAPPVPPTPPSSPGPGGPAEVDAPLAATIEQLALELADRARFSDQAAQLDWVIEILILRGHLTENHRPMIKRIRARRTLPILFGRPDEDAPDPDIDCASRLPLCHGRCCSFNVALTEHEIRAGAIEWNLHEPYKLAKDPTTGYCANLDRTGGCTKYDVRPGTCRKYDCRQDSRVWIDFDGRVPAPMPEDVVPLGQWSAEPGDGDGDGDSDGDEPQP